MLYYPRSYNKNKYHNVKTKVGNITFDSKLEAKRYTELIREKRTNKRLNLTTLLRTYTKL